MRFNIASPLNTDLSGRYRWKLKTETWSNSHNQERYWSISFSLQNNSVVK